MNGQDHSLFGDSTLLLEFIAESLERLESIESRILEYEKSQEDGELLDSISRAMHSMKGAASFFNLTDISRLSHKLETLLDEPRRNKRKPSPEFCDMLLSGSDLLNTLIIQLSESTDSRIQAEVLNVREMTGKPDNVRSSRPDTKTFDDAVEIFVSAARERLEFMRNCQRRIAVNEVDEKTVATYLREAVTLKNAAGYMGFDTVMEASARQEDILRTVKSGESGFEKEFVSLLDESIAAIERGLNAGFPPATLSVAVADSSNAE